MYQIAKSIRSLLKRDELPVVDVSRFEAIAKRKLSKLAYSYIRSAGAAEFTARENQRAFERLRLNPRTLVDVSSIDTKVTAFGHTHDHPIWLAPTAYHGLFHREGERETARGANAARAVFAVSTFTNTPIDEITRQAQQPVWYQLYMQRDREFSRAMVERALAAGCSTLILTVDAPVLGSRYSEIEFALPPGLDCAMLRGLNSNQHVGAHSSNRQVIYSEHFEPKLTWRDVDWLKSFVKVPILLKGIVSPEDTVHAIESGVDGVIVSNHGGRNLDMVPAAIEALPVVVEAAAGRIPIFMDSGVRHGTDVLMALALGAKAVFIGRPFLYGLAAGGAKGVERVVSILREEFERAMALAGRRSIAEIDRSVIWNFDATRESAAKPHLSVYA